MPTLTADEYEARVSYRVRHESNLEVDRIATIVFSGCYALMFGPPSDEAMEGHPLAERGLTSYGAFEVEGSSWVRALEGMNRIHPGHQPSRYERLRHFVLTFHDTTLECVAEGFSVST